MPNVPANRTAVVDVPSPSCILQAARADNVAALRSLPGITVVLRDAELRRRHENSRIWKESWLSAFFHKPCNHELFVLQSLNMEGGEAIPPCAEPRQHPLRRRIGPDCPWPVSAPLHSQWALKWRCKTRWTGCCMWTQMSSSSRLDPQPSPSRCGAAETPARHMPSSKTGWWSHTCACFAARTSVWAEGFAGCAGGVGRGAC